MQPDLEDTDLAGVAGASRWDPDRLRNAAACLAAVAAACAPPHEAHDIHAPVIRAGDSLGGLLAVYGLTLLKGKPLPVSRGGCDNTVFARPEENHAFRAWHDMCHLRAQADFSIGGEMRTAAMQADDIRNYCRDNSAAALEQDTVSLLWEEILGQALYFQVHGSFPVNQRGFALAYLEEGPAACLRPA